MGIQAETTNIVTNKKKSAGRTSPRPYASSPCSLHELAPVFHGQPRTEDWAAIRDWRQQQRQQLIKQRQLLDRNTKQDAGAAIIGVLENEPKFADHSVAFYWPLEGEVDLRPLMRTFLHRNISVALPVIVKQSQPLEFWAWDDSTQMRPHPVWDIPVPVERNADGCDRYRARNLLARPIGRHSKDWSVSVRIGSYVPAASVLRASATLCRYEKWQARQLLIIC